MAYLIMKWFLYEKIKKEKVGGHNLVSFRSFKNHSVDEYEKAEGKVKLSNSEDIII